MNRILRSFSFLLTVLTGLATAGSVPQVQLQVNPASVQLSSVSANPVPVTQTLTITSSGDASGTHIAYSAFVQSTSPVNPTWLSLTGAANGTTPATITVSALATGLAEGVYSAQILVGATGTTGSATIANSPLFVPVTFTVAKVSAAPATLSFTYQVGAALPQPQAVQVSGPAAAVGFTATPATATGGEWLEVAPTSGTTPGTVTASLNPAVVGTLVPGTYNGTISLTATGDSATVSVPVALTVSTAPQVTTSPASLNFGYQIGGTNNSTQQNLEVTSSGGAVTFQAIALVNPNPAGVSWLVVSNQDSSVTPATLTIGVSPGDLAAGTYTGQVDISVSGMAIIVVNVTLTVSTNPLIGLNPTFLSFAYQIGGSIPAAQSIGTSSTGAALNYSLFPSTTSGGSWLEAVSGNTTPNPFSVSVNPAGLGAGVYSGQVSVSANGAANATQQVPVSLTVTNDPLVQAFPSPLIFVYQTGQATPATQLVAISSSTGEQLSFNVTSSTVAGGKWLTAAVVTPSTPGTIRVSVTTANLTPGTYTGTVLVTAVNPSGVPVPDSPLSIPVTYYVSGDPLLTVSPYQLAFTATAGTQSLGQTVVLTSTSSALNYTITPATPNTGPWMLVASQPGTTPGSFTVYASAGNLSPGTYNGTITVGAANPSAAAVSDNPIVIPVTFQVLTGTISATPAAVTFNQTLGGALPAAQTIKLSGTGSQPLNFTAVASNNSGVAWLNVTPGSGGTPSTLTVSADGSKLSPGTYIGLVTVTAPNAAGSPITIQVTLNVAGAPAIALTPATLQFNSQVGGAAPATQTIAVASSSGSLAFTAAATVEGNAANWLSVSPISGGSPATLTISANPTGLAAGTYTGAISVSAAGAGNSPQSVAVTLTVSAPATPLPTSVTNAASGIPGAVAPGEIVSIYGTNLGPAGGAGTVITNNSVATTVAGIQVMFDNNAAPLLYVSPTQINAVVPFELTGQLQTNMKVLSYGVPSASINLEVAATAPGLFTQTENGSGQGAIINSTGGINNSGNPAPQGSTLVLYATGGGETSPVGVTGGIAPNDGSGLKHVAGVTVTVAGLECKVAYAGSAPGFVEGALQINAQLPAGVPSGTQAVVITVNGVSSQAETTVAIQ